MCTVKTGDQGRRGSILVKKNDYKKVYHLLSEKLEPTVNVTTPLPQVLQ